MTTGEVEEETSKALISDAALSLPPPHVVRDLLSVGVCVRCIFRLFGYRGQAYSCWSLSGLKLLSFLEEHNNLHAELIESRRVSNGLIQCSSTSEELENGGGYCSICLGILQLASNHETNVKRVSIDDFTAVIANRLIEEAHQIDGFSLEVSIPPVIVANERAICLYVKKKYEGEEWTREKLLSELVPVKEALRSSITNSLESCLDVKSGGTSFRIRLEYTHPEDSIKLRSFLANIYKSKRRKIGTEGSKDFFEGSYDKTRKTPYEHSRSESNEAIYKTLGGLDDHVFCEHFVLPPEKIDKPCHLTISGYRMPIYIGGRYLKFSRRVSQSRWIIDDERMGEASVEEIVGNDTLLVCKGDNYKFHAAGREDIDVRMLGSGRPFLVEVSNARCRPSLIDIQDITDKINDSNNKYVKVRNLKVLGSEAWTLMREGEAEKQKQYVALVWISRPLTEEDVTNILSTKDMDISQRTPIRVLHRRSPLERKRAIHWMMIEKIAGSSQYFLLHLCTQAGTYIKEFVHGDLGRTHPSIGSILGCRAEILQLDVTDVKMDCFN